MIPYLFSAMSQKELLANCYFNSMKLAMDNGIRSIAFPSISTGVYSFPVELAAKIAVHTVNRFLQDNPDCFDLVHVLRHVLLMQFILLMVLL